MEYLNLQKTPAMPSPSSIFLSSVIKRFTDYKKLAQKTFDQLSTQELHFQPNEESNSIAIIIQHMAGNMLSRWTDFLTTDGEKEWRDRDSEFEIKSATKEELLAFWEKGWACLMNTLGSLTENDLLTTIRIRGEELTAMDAIIRQMAHYPYHIGQIIYAAKLIKNKAWINLSVPKGGSAQFNSEKRGPYSQ
jgi:hypothetical protein